MKKIIVAFFIIEISIIMFIMGRNLFNTETVYLSGKIINFEFQTEDNNLGNRTQLSNQRTGTLTCVRENGEFIALGHAASNGKISDEVDGNCYFSNSVVVDKSSNKVGHLYGNSSNIKLGTLTSNKETGLYGYVDNIEKENYVEIQTASKFEIQNGDAEIWLDIDGNGIQKYKVEIEEINYFSSDKNVKIKILDENLLNLTGGFVQGMSGAPVVQNDKLIGAVNNIDLSNYTEGYAIFIDNMLNK